MFTGGILPCTADDNDCSAHRPKDPKDGATDEREQDRHPERARRDPDGEACDPARQRQNGSDFDPPEVIAQHADEGTTHSSAQIEQNDDVGRLRPG